MREAETGTTISAICSTAHISIGTFYRWRRRFGGLPPAAVARLGEIERENARLRTEVTALRRSLLALTPADLYLRRQPRPAEPSQPVITPIRFRGAHASVGRYASVRTAN